MCHFAFGYINDDGAAEDIVQETFVYLWENEQSFVNPIAIKVFLYRTVKNKCLNQLKHLKLKDEKLQDINRTENYDQAFEQEVIKEETIRQFYQAIEELPQSNKAVILLALQGMKNDEIAEQLQLSVNTVKTHKKNAYALLRIQLKDVFPGVILLLELLK